MTTEGRIPFRGFETWYRSVGEREEDGRLPLLCLHGGPGATHDYLEPLEAVSETGRRVVFYDQLGCGNQTSPTIPRCTPWTSSSTRSMPSGPNSAWSTFMSSATPGAACWRWSTR